VRKDHPKYEQKRRLEEQLLESIHRSDQPVRVSVTGSGDPFASRLFLTSCAGSISIVTLTSS